MRTRPAHLQEGDLVGIVALSSPPNMDNLTRGLQYLEELGLRYILGESVQKHVHYLAGSDRDRARDFEAMIEDPEVKAIFCASGGYGAARVADKIDYMLLEENSKIFWGFSDSTFLHTAIGQLSNLVTFHGPTISSIGHEGLPERTKMMFKQLFAPAEIYYDKNISKLTTIHGGRVRGELVGGNLTRIVNGIGTKFELDTKDKVLLIEDIGIEPAQIDELLNQLKQSRKLEQAAGIIIGDFTLAEPRDYQDAPSVDALFDEYFAHINKPVVSGFKIGHDALNVGLPLGVDVILDADEKYLAVLPGVE